MLEYICTYNQYYNKECLADYCGKIRQRVWTFPLLVYVLLHYLFLLYNMTTRPIWLGTQGETGVDAGPPLPSFCQGKCGLVLLSLASLSNWVWTKLDYWQERFSIVQSKQIFHALKMCWELGRGTQIEWPGCILICGAVLFLGFMGCASGLVYPCCTSFLPLLCVCVHSTLRPACVVLCVTLPHKKAPRHSRSELTISTELGHRATWNGQCATVHDHGGVTHGEDF